MKRLTKDQRYNRKRRKKGKPNYNRVLREDGRTVLKVSRRALSVSVNLEAFERLTELSQQEGLDKWVMLTRMIIYSIPSYSYYSGDSNQHSWDDHLLKPTNRSVRYKGSKGTKQITYDISSTAWNKLECHKTATGKSKARLVQDIILHYKPTSQKQREANKRLRREDKEKYGFALVPKLNAKPTKAISNTFKLERVNGDFVYVHRKGISPEYWDDEELDEYERLISKDRPTI